MKILQETALTYDDVLLVPQYSDVDSRRILSTQTRLTNQITLQIPIVSANMDVVTEYEMAIAMAREGGIGIIHRFLSIDEQARQIERVKKAESFIVENPITMTVAHTIGDVKKIMDETGTGGILILNGGDKLVGIITTRDLLFEENDDKPVGEVMQNNVVTASSEISLKGAKKILQHNRIDKLPLGDSNGRVTGLGSLKEMLNMTKH